MESNEILTFARKTGKFEENEKLTMTELSDGNINYVYRVSGEKGKSVIVKHSTDKIRTSGNPLSTNRMMIEVHALQAEYNAASNYVPKVYCVDEKQHIFAMEDLWDCSNLRLELMQQKTFPNLSKDLSEFLVKTLVGTLDATVDQVRKKEQVKQFINPEMCLITERLVFTEPYNEQKNRNVLFEPNESFIVNEIYHDDALKLEVAKLKTKYLTQAQSLLHGDLHTGSIFVNQTKTKILDSEFAFYGPAGYDIGNVLANLIFSYARAKYTTDNENFLQWIRNEICSIVDSFSNDGINFMKEHTIDYMDTIDGYPELTIEGILEDSAGMAGTELIRRIVGDAKVADITTIQDNECRKNAERFCLNVGKTLILKRMNSFHNGKDYCKLLK